MNSVMAATIRGNLFKSNLFLSLNRTVSNTGRFNVQNNEGIDDMPVPMENPYKKDPKQCILCKMNIVPDYKNTKLLSQFVSPFTGRVYGRYITGLCRKKQEDVVREILKSQSAGLMPYYNKDPIYLEDPKLFNPERPIRPHDFS